MTENLSAPQGHILHFYEDLDMKIHDFQDMISSFLEAKIEHIEEKIDGQNLTFTVRNGKVETFSKGATWNTIQKGGKKLSDYESLYANKPDLKNSFIKSYETLQFVVDSHPDLSSRLFKNGSVIIETQMVLANTKNLVVYENDAIVFVKAFNLNPIFNGNVDLEAYHDFLQICKNANTGIKICEVPVLRLKKSESVESIKKELFSDLEAILSLADVGISDTIGDLIVGLLHQRLVKEGMSSHLAKRIATRIGKDQKSAFTAKDGERAGFLIWEKVKFMEENYFLEETIIPLERILQKLSIHVFKNCDFSLSSNVINPNNETVTFIKKVRQSFIKNKIIADKKQLRTIEVSLKRIEKEEEFEKPVEGIVFEWKGKLRKLTGLFSPINKIIGLFVYGKSPAKFSNF